MQHNYANEIKLHEKCSTSENKTGFYIFQTYVKTSRLKCARLQIYLLFLFRFSQEQSLRFFENKVMRELPGSKNEEVKGNWRKLHIGTSTFAIFMLFTMAVLGWRV